MANLWYLILSIFAAILSSLGALLKRKYYFEYSQVFFMNNHAKFYRFVLGFVVVGKTIKMIWIIHDPFICKFFYRRSINL